MGLPAAVLLFPLAMPLPLALPVLLLSFLHPLFLSLRPWRLLLRLYSPWLLSMLLHCRYLLRSLLLHCRSTLLLLFLPWRNSLRSLLLALRPWRPLLRLYSPWLLSMLLHCRSSLLLHWRNSLGRNLLRWLRMRNALLNRRLTLSLLRPRASRPGLFLPPPRSWCGRWSLSSLLLIIRADCRVARLIPILLMVQRLLLLHLAGIPVPRILPLVDRQRGAHRICAALPLVPSSSLLLPLRSPVRTPAGWCIRPPSAEVHGGTPVVAHRDSQDEHRDDIRLDNPPGSVVPVARVPVIVQVNPVQAVVEEIVGIHPWSVVDRVARHRYEFREQR
jgi:hypothetical protein